MNMKGKRKCSFRLPKAEKMDGVPYMERWAIYCDCGMTIFGNTEDECKASWYKHVEGKL